jgi:hypothetical protein
MKVRQSIIVQGGEHFTCTTCKHLKPRSEFYAKKGGCGIKSQCKCCHSATTVETMDVDKKRVRNAAWMAKQRVENPAKVKKWESGRVRPSDFKQRARKKLNYAVATGKLERPENCEGCGRQAEVEGHHPDYSQPLVVVWLCTKCHGVEHRKAA